ncbi:MAG: YeeE/YedE family protein [Candidatus Rokubacteria bacterium]|nr:YeeE/YedE family protein [Candidatus Rokubacteria bacterium]
MRGPLFALFGLLFGFVLARGRLADYDTMAAMFRLADFHVFGVIGSAIATAAAGLWILRRAGERSLDGRRLELRRKPWTPGVVAGGLLLGVGWGLTGACPGTSLVMVGEGKAAALFTVAGVLAGTYLYGLVRSRHAVTSMPPPVPGRVRPG